MKNYKFVYPAYEKHIPYRDITKNNNLKRTFKNILEYRPKNVEANIALVTVMNGLNIEDITWLSKDPVKRQEQIGWKFITENGGVNLCNSHIQIRGIRHGGLRLIQHAYDYSFPRAFEPLAFGVGVFRKSELPRVSL